MADTPEFFFNPGKAPSAISDEHVHIQITLPEDIADVCSKYGEAGLASFMVLTAEESPGSPKDNKLRSFAFPAPTACWLQVTSEDDLHPVARTRLQIRANCGLMLEMLPNLLHHLHDTRISSYRVKFFIVGQS